ncbi:MAG: hypothetical protein IJG84_02085, partial [Kiritimatiellae bacterium]|nr:hypothetical protein [Kiritimatiellia bacterium]
MIKKVVHGNPRVAPQRRDGGTGWFDEGNSQGSLRNNNRRTRLKLRTFLLSAVVSAILPCAAANLVFNGSFESYTGSITANSGKFQYFSNNPNNFLMPDNWTEITLGSTGLSTASDGTWKDSKEVIDGNVVLFLQKNCSLSQSISIPEAGRYRIQFKYAARSQNYPNGLIHIEIDGMEVGCVDSGSSQTYRLAHMETELTAGSHTLVIRHDNSQQENACSTIDVVSIFKAEEGNLIANGSFESYTGSITGTYQYLDSAHILDVWTRHKGV